MKKIPLLAIAFTILAASCMQPIYVLFPDYSDSSSDLGDVCIPVFCGAPASAAGRSVSSRGIINMTPSGTVFDNVFQANAVMGSIPIMVSLDLVEDADESVLETVPDSFKVYGYPIKFDAENSRVNNDGVYMKYYIMSEQPGNDDFAIGYIDYYYSTKEKCFSYRQVVTLNIDAFGKGSAEPDGNPDLNEVLVMEFIDVPVSIDRDGNVSYAYGQFDNQGRVRKDGTIDFISFGVATNDQAMPFLISRQYPSARSNGEIYASTCISFYGETTGKLSYNEAGVENLLKKYAGDDLKFSYDEANKLGMDFADELIEIVYKKYRRHDTYHSYGAYKNSDNLRDLNYTMSTFDNSNLNNKVSVNNTPCLFNYINGDVASTTPVYNGDPNFNKIKNEDDFKKSGYGDFGITWEGEDTAETIRAKIIRKQLIESGLNDESFIECYIMGSGHAGENNAWSSYEITAHTDSEEYKEKLGIKE